MWSKNYQYFESLDYDELMLDEGEKEQKIQEKKEQEELLVRSTEAFNQFKASRFYSNGVFNNNEKLKENMDNAFENFEKFYNRLLIDYKVEFCKLNLPFKYTLREAIIACPVHEDWQILYHLMRTAGWPEEVRNYKFKNLKQKEKDKIKNLINLENVLRYKNPIDPDFNMLTALYQNEVSSFASENFGNCLKRTSEEVLVDDRESIHSLAVDLAQELDNYSKKKKKVLEELQTSFQQDRLDFEEDYKDSMVEDNDKKMDL